MHTIQLDIPDELAEKLAPYHDHLLSLLELGLHAWLQNEQQERLALRERVHKILAASGQVTTPGPYASQKPYVRHTPVPITGTPVSDLIIEQRGPQ